MVCLRLAGGCLTEISGTQPADREPTEAERLYAQGDFAAVEAVCRLAAKTRPHDATTHYNLGVALVKLDRLEEALICFRQAIELNPSFALAYTNFAFCLNAFNLIEQARKGFAIARSLSPDNPVPAVNEGIAALALGDYEKGWDLFASRWKIATYARFRRTFDQPAWKGENLSGKTLFVYAEQGFGDTIHMARYIPLLAAQGATIILECQPALSRLLRHLKEAVVISKGDALSDFDYHTALMDIPGIWGTRLETIPSSTPYLFADTDEIDFYRRLIPPTKKRRIGVAWAGRASHENDHNRSLALTQLAPLLAINTIEWISLQRVVPPADAADVLKSSLINWGENFPDFAATAAAIMSLDLVITVDTAVAHLAGALGKPVWILLPFYADWRWLMYRDDNPWYPTARLFRQQERKNWAAVMERVRQELRT